MLYVDRRDGLEPAFGYHQEMTGNNAKLVELPKIVPVRLVVQWHIESDIRTHKNGVLVPVQLVLYISNVQIWYVWGHEWIRFIDFGKIGCWEYRFLLYCGTCGNIELYHQDEFDRFMNRVCTDVNSTLYNS